MKNINIDKRTHLSFEIGDSVLKSKFFKAFNKFLEIKEPEYKRGTVILN